MVGGRAEAGGGEGGGRTGEVRGQGEGRDRRGAACFREADRLPRATAGADFARDSCRRAGADLASFGFGLGFGFGLALVVGLAGFSRSLLSPDMRAFPRLLLITQATSLSASLSHLSRYAFAFCGAAAAA